MEHNDRKKYEEELNAQFRSAVRNGEDVTPYFHVPKNLLTKEIEDYLNNLLDEMAFTLAFSDSKGFEFGEKMLVYMDKTKVVHMETQEEKLSVLNRLLGKFEQLEKFERCAQILEAIETINATIKATQNDN